ncbi:hypothetical protein ACFWSF_01645 [Streptomyces sp. NPDC058611]|uniref:hypothetical protein n=1 Tax=unclassified Streptomyces TaxID=2593676 RepID=UPI00365AE075
MVRLVVRLVVRRRVSPRCPVLVVAGTAASAVSPDLRPLGVLLFAAAASPRPAPCPPGSLPHRACPDRDGTA